MIRDRVRTSVREILARKPVRPYEPRSHTVMLLRPDHLGDLLFLRPGLARFRELMRDWHISLAVGPWSRSVVDHDQNVDEIVEIRYPGFVRTGSGNPLKPYQQLFDEAARLREERPAAVVVLRDDHWWGGLMAHLAGVPVIIGADTQVMQGLLTDRTEPRSTHAVQRNIEILEFAASRLGACVGEQSVSPENDPLRWNVADEDRERAGELLQHAGSHRPFIAIHPGSGAPVKLWPAERWAEVADVISGFGLDVVLTGSRSETPFLNAIRSAATSRVHSLGGETSLRELAAVFDQALLVAGVDSGPLHLAVAVNRPTVQIYGPSDEIQYGPWGNPEKHRVVSARMCCRACGDLSLGRHEGAGCMLSVQASKVIDVISGILER